MTALSYRVDQLREELTSSRELDDEAFDDLRAVVSTVRSWAHQPGDDEVLAAGADEMDGAMASVGAFQDLRAAYPSLGRVLGGQRWVRSAPAAPAEAAPAFPPVEFGGAADRRLFTSSAVHGHGPSMWQLHLELYDGSSSHPLPWDVWALEPEPGVRACFVDSAADWVELLRAYPAVAGGSAAVDWGALAGEFDGLKIGLGGVVATQGVSFPVDGRRSAPTFWDVETTLWFRAAFEAPVLVERYGGKDRSDG